jgi:uncharacterized membrane protein
MGCVAGGLGLLAWALRRRSPAGFGAVGLGGWLLYQAYTGSNPLLRPLGIRVNPEPSETAARETIVLDEVITIGRPRGEIHRFWRTGDAAARRTRLLEVTVLDEGVRVGASKGPGAGPARENRNLRGGEELL